MKVFKEANIELLTDVTPLILPEDIFHLILPEIKFSDGAEAEVEVFAASITQTLIEE